MKFQNQVLSLHSDAVAADTLMIEKLSGREVLSGLFRFELDLISTDPELDLEAVLYAPAKLGIKVQVRVASGKFGTATREICGVFEEFEQREEGQGWTRYRGVLVPKMWQATRSYRSRIFQDMTIEDVVCAVLEKDGMDPQLDFEFQLQRHGDEDPKERPIYPEREYVVQYEESDWQFLARWLEHEGIYFYFVNDSGEEKVVFADTESSYAEPAFGSTYPYRPESKGEGTDSDQFTEEEVRSFRCRQSRLPTHVTVNDYNWRVPSARLHFSESVRDDGTGLQTQYNDHFKDESQGKALAKLRREELVCRARTYHGTGSCRAFRPGATFSLEEHFRDDFNRSYLLVDVEHEAEQMISLESSTITGVKYENRFTAVHDDQPWRPERTTPWPSIKGVMHAHVDAEGDGSYAELDEHGRYKLRLPFDEHAGDAKAGKASRWVRMAQPYAGVDSGFHFPLLKGTEVLLTHIDGDPDRPVISGAVPNPETESPTTAAGPTRSAMRTASGNTMQIDDAEESPGFLFVDATASYVCDRRRHKGPAAGGSGSSSSGPGAGSGGAVAGHQKPNSQPAADAPRSGSGMTTAATSKESGWDADIASVWATFCNGAAITDIRTNGKYRDGTSLSLSTWDGPSQGGVTPPETSLDKTGLDGVLNYMTQVSTNLRNQNKDGEEATPTKDNPKGASLGAKDFQRQPLSKLHNFTGEAYGSRLRCWVGDDLMIKVGDKITYNDVTRDISIGTGGFGWSEEHGDTSDHSWHWGDSTSYSKHVGHSNSTSIQEGGSSGFSYSYGDDTSCSITFGKGATFSLTGTLRSDSAIVLGGINANSLFIGAKASLDIEVSAKLEMFINASGTFKMGISNTQTFCNLGSKYQIDVPDSTKVAVRDTIVCLQENQALLQEMNAVLQGQQASVQNMTNCVKEDQNVLQKTGNALSHVGNAISTRMNNIDWGQVAVAMSTQAGAVTHCHAFTSM